MLNHGGRLRQAAETYNIPLQQWIDLSTGINPDGWPVADIPPGCFSRLPEDDDELIAVARDYYQVDNLLPIAGSQSVIQLLPRLRSRCKVAVPEVGYAEHAHAWEKSGHDVVKLSSMQIDRSIDQYDVVVIINPNNPTGEYFKRQQLLEWHEKLARKNGWLIVDEAFLDADGAQSLLSSTGMTGLIVLRSIGKFFGLAGIRSGFAFAEPKLLNKIVDSLGPWALSGPSRFVTAAALADRAWQQRTRQQIKKKSLRLMQLIKKHTGIETVGTELFQTLFCDNAVELHDRLACAGVLTRLLDNASGIRFGLPADDQWPQLENRLKDTFSSI
ncbi:MAG: threonine-phosphate decarboxylase CobD [Gammaproteobacteria bacterium]|nr:threonine-phosphate decarboxylase CobD [Gammaproteobacteria bacterium]